MKYKQVGLLSLGHMFTDVNQGALPAMLPFLIAAYDLSYTAAATVVFVVNMSSSVAQPLFGLAADRLSKPWLLPGGLFFAGLGLGLTGFVTSFEAILLLGVVSGIGIAAYHPEAARLVNFAAGNSKGTAMSIFGVGGNLGFAIGPMIITIAILQWGLQGTLLLVIPVSVMAMVMIFHMQQIAPFEAGERQTKQHGNIDIAEDNWNGFAKLAAFVSIRSILFFGLNVFIPIYWMSELSQSKVAGALALTIFAGSGILGTLIGGNLADRVGRKRVIVLGAFFLSMVYPVFLLIDNVHLATLLMALIGFLIFATYSPAILLGQSYLPNRIGLSSGVTLGLAVAIGGGGAPFLGKIADSCGIWTTFASLSGLPFVILLLAFSLPESRESDIKLEVLENTTPGSR